VSVVSIEAPPSPSPVCRARTRTQHLLRDHLIILPDAPPIEHHIQTDNTKLRIVGRRGDLLALADTELELSQGDTLTRYGDGCPCLRAV